MPKAREQGRGQGDGKPEPEEARRILYLLKLSRHVQERMESMHRQGRIPGPIHFDRGREGTHVAVAHVLRPDDSLFGTEWDLFALLAKGVRLGRALANVWGRTGGTTGGRDGDGSAGQATWGGRWNQSVEASAIHRLPVVWVVEQSGAASSAPSRAAASGIPSVRVDGSDVLEVYGAAVEAVERARSGGGPSIVEAAASRRDPVSSFAEVLVSEGAVDEAEVAAIQARVEKEFNEAYEFAQSSPLPDPAELTRGVFANPVMFAGEGDQTAAPAGSRTRG
ncbi:MAG: thiamine pyrophosphate-dependent enzyme [Actinomycetota bacterium]|nr:thiamine pyrophosphate-dependent enzyme [Actinomycetota bacterium]